MEPPPERGLILVPYVDWLLTSLISAAPAQLTAELAAGAESVEWRLENFDPVAARTIDSLKSRFFRPVLARIASSYMSGRVYGGFRRFRLRAGGMTYPVAFYLANDSLTGLWFRGRCGRHLVQEEHSGPNLALETTAGKHRRFASLIKVLLPPSLSVRHALLLTNTLPFEEIIPIALREFQKVLQSNLDHPWKPRHGHPPKCGYIEHVEYCTEPYFRGFKEPILGAWSISVELAELLLTRSGVPSTKTDGMFFDILIGNFGVSRDHSRLSVNWQTGPRYGRGFVHSIERGGDGTIFLGSPKSTWMS